MQALPTGIVLSRYRPTFSRPILFYLNWTLEHVAVQRAVAIPRHRVVVLSIVLNSVLCFVSAPLVTSSSSSGP